jgi:hypothetical protein
VEIRDVTEDSTKSTRMIVPFQLFKEKIPLEDKLQSMREGRDISLF